MNVLVACECSGVVRDAFREAGHEAWSCDHKKAETCGEFHLRGDVLLALRQENNGFYYRELMAHTRWDLLIAHPPCTDLSVSGALHFKAKRADGRQQQAIDFFMMLVNADVPRICIENPVGIMSTIYLKPDQYVQPYEFGDNASKNTCLWLKGLLPLRIDPAEYVKPRMVCQCGEVYPYDLEFSGGCPKCGPGHAKPRWANQCNSGQNKLGPSPERAANRARTYKGIARAMAAQWGKITT